MKKRGYDAAAEEPAGSLLSVRRDGVAVYGMINGDNGNTGDTGGQKVKEDNSSLSPEEKLDRIIDDMNAGREPGPARDAEAAELAAAVRMVKTLDPSSAEPHPDFQRRMARLAAREEPSRSQEPSSGRGARIRRPKWWAFLAAALAAALVFWLLPGSRFGIWPGGGEKDIVLAMERAVGSLEGYYGVLEKRAINMAGDEWVVRRARVWVRGDSYFMEEQGGEVTVNNGRLYWKVVPSEKQVIMLPLLPDSRTGFDLAAEAARAASYPHEIVGTEVVAGRRAVHMEVSPPGGLPYDLWVDADTNMPLRLRTAMHNGLQMAFTYTEFEENPVIDEAVFSFQVPDGYEQQGENSGLILSGLDEAARIVGFAPLMPDEEPRRIIVFDDWLGLDYGGSWVKQRPAAGPMDPVTWGALGSADDGSPVEVTGESIRWHAPKVSPGPGGSMDGPTAGQAGTVPGVKAEGPGNKAEGSGPSGEKIEVTVYGDRKSELALQMAPDLILPDPSADLVSGAGVKVPVDMESARGSQQQVDGGHSPWQIDPVQVAMVYVDVSIRQGSIEGDPAMDTGGFNLERSTGVEAVVFIEHGPVGRVYLKRLIRQDDTGIWSVVGYDMRN